MVKFKILNNSIDNMQFVVNASKNKKEAGVYAYRFDTSDYRCLYSYSYNPKIGEYREWLGDFQKINSRDEGYVISHIAVSVSDSDLEDAYIKLQAGDKQKDKPFEIIFNSYQDLKAMPDLKTILRSLPTSRYFTKKISIPQKRYSLQNLCLLKLLISVMRKRQKNSGVIQSFI